MRGKYSRDGQLFSDVLDRLIWVAKNENNKRQEIHKINPYFDGWVDFRYLFNHHTNLRVPRSVTYDLLRYLALTRYIDIKVIKCRSGWNGRSTGDYDTGRFCRVTDKGWAYLCKFKGSDLSVRHSSFQF